VVFYSSLPNVGSGLQILAMTLSTMVCAVLGLTSQTNRGGMITTLLLLFVFMGSIAGYSSARVYKLFGGKEWCAKIIFEQFF
jgi:transmembrane 9 superfamily protein 2/4